MVCHEDGCKKRAYYGRVYGEKPEFCPEHGKKRRFINVKNKRCIKCNKRASYGVRGKGAEYCAKHGKEIIGLTNIVSRLCSKKGCTKQTRFGSPNGKKRTHCAEHKKKDFIPDYKKCRSEGCSKQPSYGIPGERPEYCAEHGKEKDHMNIVTKRCSEDGCDIYPNFGPVDGKATHCVKHKKEHFIDVNHAKCSEDGCELNPSYGEPDGKAEYCSNHGSKKGLVNVVNKRCVSDACSFYPKNNDKFFASKINPKNGKMELCSNCWRIMYPELSKKRKVRKEQFILAEVQHQIPELGDYFLTWDCKIPGQSCVAFRPDMAWEINDTLLHIEIDEDGINHEDDDQRLAEIHSASNKKNHVCIRFNPDKSKDGSPPCMKQVTLTNGESVYSKEEKEWNKRMNKLIPELRNAYEDALVNKSVCGKRKLCF